MCEHPERAIFAKGLCKACYFRVRRAKLAQSKPTNDLALTTKELENIVDNRLIKLGIWDGIQEGNGELMRKFWADVTSKDTVLADPLPTGLTLDITHLHDKK